MKFCKLCGMNVSDNHNDIIDEMVENTHKTFEEWEKQGYFKNKKMKD